MYKQLLDYASGARPNAIMSPIAKALTQAQMEDVSAYYASIEDAPYFPPPEVDGLTLQHGGRLSAVGSAEKGIQACVNRSEEHTSELQSLLRISYAVFCLKNNN